MSSLRPSSEFTRSTIQFALSGVGGVSSFQFDLSPNKPANVLLGPSGCGKTLALSLISAGLQGCLPERGELFGKFELIVNGASAVSAVGAGRSSDPSGSALSDPLQRDASVDNGLRPVDGLIPEIPIRRISYVSPFADPGGLWPIVATHGQRAERVRRALDRFPFRQRLQLLESEVAAFDTAFSEFGALLERSPEWLVRCPTTVIDTLSGVRSLLSDGSLPYLGSTAEGLEAVWVRARVASLENRSTKTPWESPEYARLADALACRARSLATLVADPGYADAERTRASVNRLLMTMDCRFSLETAGDGTVEFWDELGDAVSAQTVSSGIAQALDLWTAVALAPPGTLLLIDDPETGMDVRWRGAFLPFLLTSLSERACWAIVATQCPAIVSNRIHLVVEPSGGVR